MSHLGAYRVLKQLGEGGMAAAWLAVGPGGQQVVLKIPLMADPSTTTRLHDEAQAGRRIRHPHVVSTLDFFVDAGRPVLVIEFVDGCALRDLRTRDSFRNPLPAAGVAWLGRTISEALCAIHEAKDDAGRPLGMLHRDVTSSNILLGKDGSPKLIDLGIARSAENNSEATRVGMLKGTLRYLAPELLLGEGYSPATDLWALGVCLFEAALGRQMVSGQPGEIFKAVVAGTYQALLPGERLEPALKDALFALLTNKDSRLRNARAAVAMFSGLQAKLGADGQQIVAALVPYAQESSDSESSKSARSHANANANDASSVDVDLSSINDGGPDSDLNDVGLASLGVPRLGIGDLAFLARGPLSSTRPLPRAPADEAGEFGEPTLVTPPLGLAPVPHHRPLWTTAPGPALPMVDVRPNPVAPCLPLAQVVPQAHPASKTENPQGTAENSLPCGRPGNFPAAGTAQNSLPKGDVLPEGASTLKMPVWMPPEPAEDVEDVAWEPNTDPTPEPIPPSRPPPPLAPMSDVAKPTRLLPIAALRTTRDDQD